MKRLSQFTLPLILWFLPVTGWAQTATFGEVVGLGGTPSDVVLDELRGRLYLVNDRANRVDIYGIPEKRLVGAIAVGTQPLAAAMSMDGAFLYVTNNLSSSLSIVDLSNYGVIQTVTLPARPEGVETGADGRVLISTVGSGVGNAQNTLLIFDRSQQTSQQLFAVPSPPPPSTPAPLPPTQFPQRQTTFRGKLARTPDGQFIVGVTTPGNNTYMFVYEAASGVVLRSRNVGGQSTVLSMAPDGSRFMAGFTMFDTATLGVIGQQNFANAPFTFASGLNFQQNTGGSAFSPDNQTLYSAFNSATFSIPASRPNSSTLLISDARNLGIQLGIRMPESVVAKMVTTSDGANAWALSESGMIYLPLSKLYDYPILQPETTTVFLAQDECNRGISSTTIRVNNLGKGKLTFSVPPNFAAALVAQVSSGVAPATIKFTMEPGRAGVLRQAGTNLSTGTATMTGNVINVNLASNEAINYPNTIRVYMNYRNPDQRGLIYPVPTTPNNSPFNSGSPSGNEGLQDLVLDEARGRLYVTNAGYNRIEVFDLKRQRFIEPIPAGQLPHQMALATDGTTLYVANTGGESISAVDLDIGRVIGQVEFPPIPRAGNSQPITVRTLAAGLFGLQFIMSNGSQWKVAGNQATVRPVNSVTPVNIGGCPACQMIASPNNEYILTLSGNGLGYLYDSKADTYVAGRTLFNNPIQSYYGPIAVGKESSYLLANGLVLNSSMTIVGGAERPGAPQTGPPPAPGQPPVVTVVSAGQRNIAAVAPVNETQFLRLSTPVRQNIGTQTRDDARATLELVDLRTGGASLVGVAAENPQISVFGAQRANVPPRQMIVDSSGTVYAITLSGLSVLPIATASDATKPQIAAARGIVNATDGTPNIRPGSFVTVTGRNLAAPMAAELTPPPTILGGSCVTFNDLALPLLQTSSGQILAQLPENAPAGLNIVQVRSLAMGQASDPVIVTVQRAPATQTDPPEAPVTPQAPPPIPPTDPPGPTPSDTETPPAPVEPAEPE